MKILTLILAFCLLMAATCAAQSPTGGSANSVDSTPNFLPSSEAAPSTNAMFDAIDADRDGEITARELRRAVVALKRFDVDQDGKITRGEVSGGAANPQDAISRLLQNDRNGDGKLSRPELPRHLAQSLKTGDVNGDGALDRAELANVIGGTQPQLNLPAGTANGAGFRQGGFNGDPRPGVNLSQFDRNGDGQLSADEVPAQLRGTLRGTDQNGDGQLSPQELQLIEQRMNERLRGQRSLPPGVTVGPQGVSGARQKP